jgi:hypothetical protein
MDPAARSHKLLYISDFVAADVEVFTYPYLTLAGVLTGFSEPAGECTNPSGYVWITDETGEVFEYAHGGATPVNVLSAPGDPWGCAISPTNGDLAVSDMGAGQIEIFHNAAGSGTVVTDPNFNTTDFLGYDKTGDLFVDGYDFSSFRYAELPAGGSGFTDITLSQTPAGAGNVQWDGKYMAVGDSASTIYQTQGSTVVSSTTLGTRCVFQFFILPSKHKVIAPDGCGGNADIFAYPAGGSPLQTITGGLLIPIGAVLSQ